MVGRLEAMSHHRGKWYWPVEPGLSWLNPIENWGINRDKTDGCGPLCSNLPLTVVRNHDHLSSQDDKVRLPPGGGVGGTTLRTKRAIVATVAAIGTVVLAAGCSSSSSSSGSAAASSGSSGSSSASATNFATCDSTAACGGMSALVAEAKKEGQLNVITLPSNWANYGNIMSDFTKAYGIKINDANPEGSSQDELNAVKQLKGQSSAPDVVDVGGSFAVTGKQDGDWAPYEVSTWSSIPAAAKDPSGDYYADYGGYVAIGYDSSKVKVAPTSFKSLLTGCYKNQVAIDGNPTQTGSAFAAVYAAALANGGSLRQHRPWRHLLQGPQGGGQLRPGRGHSGYRAVRPDPDPDLVGLPAEL